MSTTVASRSSPAFERGLDQAAESENGDRTAAAPAHNALAERQRVHFLHDRSTGAAAAGITHRGGLIERGTPWRASGGIRSRRSGSSPRCWERSAKAEVEGAVCAWPVAAPRDPPVEREHDRKILDADVVDELIVAALHEKSSE